MDPAILDEMEKLARAKAIIRKLESSDGQNMAHETLTAGPNKGQTAGGAYGIVPNSLIDFIKQSKNRNLPVDPVLLEAMKKPHQEVTQRLNTDRDFDEKAAEMAMKLMLMKAGGNEEKAAYGWRTGHNQSQEAMEKGAAEHPYVEAYRKEKAKYDQVVPKERQNRVVAGEQGDQTALERLASPDTADRIRRMLGL